MKICGNCGNGLSDDATFCGNCGTSQLPQPLQPPQQFGAEVPRSKKKKSGLKVFLIILGIVVFLNILNVLIQFFFQ